MVTVFVTLISLDVSHSHDINYKEKLPCKTPAKKAPKPVLLGPVLALTCGAVPSGSFQSSSCFFIIRVRLLTAVLRGQKEELSQKTWVPDLVPPLGS